MFGSVFEFATGGKLFNASCFTSGIELLFGSGLELAIRGDFSKNLVLALTLCSALTLNLPSEGNGSKISSFWLWL